MAHPSQADRPLQHLPRTDSRTTRTRSRSSSWDRWLVVQNDPTRTSTCIWSSPMTYSIRPLPTNRVIFDERSDATYPGGYVDVKLATVAFLDAAAEHGDDPVRASFEDARVAWARGGYDIAGRVAAIPVLPPTVWESRAVSFMSQVRWHGTDFLPQAIALDNTFLLHHAAVHTVAAGGRALLALNRRLYPGPKYLDAALATLDRVPDGYGDLTRQLITQPSRESADAYVRALETFHPWPVDRAASSSIFIRDNELAWLTGLLPA